MWRKSLASLGQVYYINRLEDLVSLVVDVTGRAYCRGKFYLLCSRLQILACRDRVVVILRDCGSLELGSNPGPGPLLPVD